MGKSGVISCVKEFINTVEMIGEEQLTKILCDARANFKCDVPVIRNKILNIVCKNYNITLEALLKGKSHGLRIEAVTAASIALERYLSFTSKQIHEAINKDLSNVRKYVTAFNNLNANHPADSKILKRAQRAFNKIEQYLDNTNKDIQTHSEKPQNG